MRNSETKLEEKDGVLEFQHKCCTSMPVTIKLSHDPGKSIQYQIEGDGWGKEGGLCLVSTGKLTGVQMRAISAKDQLDTLLEDDLYAAVKTLAEANPEQLKWLLRSASDDEVALGVHEDDIPPEDVLRAVMAMAVFCYMEIVERGLK